MTRISFTDTEAESLYEWFLLLKQVEPMIAEECPECSHLGKRLRKFIGKNVADRITRQMKKNPY